MKGKRRKGSRKERQRVEAEVEFDAIRSAQSVEVNGVCRVCLMGHPGTAQVRFWRGAGPVNGTTKAAGVSEAGYA